MNDELLRYVAGTLDGVQTSAFEERLFTEPALASDAAKVVAMMDALRAMAAQGGVVPVIVDAELRALQAHADVRESVLIDGKLIARIGSADYVYARVSVGSHEGRVHVELCTPEGHAYFRVNEAPFDPASGEVIVLCKAHVARTTGRLIVRVVNDDNDIVGSASLDSFD